MRSIHIYIYMHRTAPHLYNYLYKWYALYYMVINYKIK